MDIQVIEKDEMKLVGISWNGTYSQLNYLPGLFDEMKSRLNEVVHQKNEQVLIAPFHSRESELTYYVTAPVEKIANIPVGMVGFTIPRKNYVVATHIGSIEKVMDTYSQMHTWMKEYGYEHDYHALSLELYNEEHRHLNTTGNLHFDIYLPVKTD